ncbi:hypothetical protein F4678DRAFT_360143 [Xylaria arbuscula]|nr:hypothetical protein F4678DRAFT_360143 [Xylaria arbuscula]
MHPEVSSSSATLRAVQLFDVLDLIAKQLNNRKALYNACLVNHAFNHVFSQQLYRCLRWDRYSCRFLVDEDKRRTLFQHNNKLASTQTFIITRSAVRRCMLDWDASHDLEWPEWVDSDEDSDAGSDVDRGPEVFHERTLDCGSTNLYEEDLPMWFDDNDPKNWEYQFAVRGPVYDQLNAAIGDICRHCPNLKRFASQDLLLKPESLQVLSSLPSLGTLSIEFPNNLRSFFGISYGPPTNHVRHVTRRSKYEHLSSYFSFSGLRKLSLLNIYQDLKAWRSRILEILVNSPGLECLSLSIEYGMVLESNSWAQRDAEESDQRVHRGLLTWISREYRERTGRKLRPIVLRLGDGIIFSDDLYNDLDTKRLGQIYLKNSYRSDNQSAFDQVSRVPNWLFREEITPNLKRVSLFEINDDTSQVFEASTRSNASSFEVQANMFNLYELPHNEAAKVRSLVYQTPNSLRAAKIMLPWLFHTDEVENSQVLGLENWTEVTDIAFSINDYVDIPTFARTNLIHLESLKNLWISVWLDEEPETSELFDYALQLAHILPTLRYVKLTWQAWRIHRVPIRNDVDNVVLEALDKWEEEVEGPDFFYVPSPLPGFREDDHVDW